MTNAYLGTTGARRVDKILKLIGGNYRYQIIDGETCIYKRPHPDYEIDIKGIITRSHKLIMTVTLWKLTEGTPARPIETLSNIQTVNQLKNGLDRLEHRLRQDDLKPVSHT